MANTYNIRKCKCCHQNVIIDEKNEWVPILQNKTLGRYIYYHKDCFIKEFGNQYDDVECKIEDFLKSYRQHQAEKIVSGTTYVTKQQRSALYNPNSKDELCFYLMREYGLTFMTKAMYIFLDSIFAGKHKSLTKPVPPEDLLEMWQKKHDYLAKVHERNRQIGKIINGEALIKYDVAILLTKYDSYVAWKEKQKYAIEETKPEYIIPIDTSVVAKKNAVNTNDEIDIMSMLDEI